MGYSESFFPSRGWSFCEVDWRPSLLYRGDINGGRLYRGVFSSSSVTIIRPDDRPRRGQLSFLFPLFFFLRDPLSLEPSGSCQRRGLFSGLMKLVQGPLPFPPIFSSSVRVAPNSGAKETVAEEQPVLSKPPSPRCDIDYHVRRLMALFSFLPPTPQKRFS